MENLLFFYIYIFVKSFFLIFKHFTILQNDSVKRANGRIREKNSYVTEETLKTDIATFEDTREGNNIK